MADPSVQKPDVFVVKGRKIATTNYVQAWNWRCEHCGWRGVDLFSERTALNEAREHFIEHHPDIATPTLGETDGEV